MGRANCGDEKGDRLALLGKLAVDLASSTARVTSRRAEQGHEARGSEWIKQIPVERRADEELRVAEAALGAQAELLVSATRASLEQRGYREHFEDAPDAYFITDVRGVVRQANRRAGKLLNIIPRYLVGKPLAVFIAGEDRALLRSILNLLCSARGVSSCALHVLSRDTSDSILVEASVSPILGPDREPGALRWILRERRALGRVGESEHAGAGPDAALDPISRLTTVLSELALERSQREQAEEQVERRDALLAAVAHELRNPLGAITSALELLLHEPQFASHHTARLLQRNVQGLTRLVEDLVDHSRIVADVFPLDQRDVDVRELVHAVCDEVASAVELKRHQLTCDFSEACGTVRGDPFRLHQLLVNLLGNAIKYTPPHGCIEFRVRTSCGEVEWIVKDSGPGIAAEHLRSIFEPFVRVAARGTSGLGLGLNIARELAELHGGSLIAESAGLGHGTTFRLRLPLLAR